MCCSMIRCDCDTDCSARDRHSFAVARQRAAVKWSDSIGDMEAIPPCPLVSAGDVSVFALALFSKTDVRPLVDLRQPIFRYADQPAHRTKASYPLGDWAYHYARRPKGEQTHLGRRPPGQ